MIGIVVSDKFLIAGVWSDDDNGGLTLHNVKQIDYNDPISDLIYKEGDLNSILGMLSEEHLKKYLLAVKIFQSQFQMILFFTIVLKRKLI